MNDMETKLSTRRGDAQGEAIEAERVAVAKTETGPGAEAPMGQAAATETVAEDRPVEGT